MHGRSSVAGFAPAAMVTIILLACASDATFAQTSPAPLKFVDVTPATGIAYSGPSWSVAWGDANSDALPDVYFGNHGELPSLFLNRGNGRFFEIESSKFARVISDSHGAAWADFDNDGDQDLVELVGAQRGTGTKSNHLYVNENGVFRDRAIERGIDDLYGRGRDPVWFDWDGDSRLDLLVLNDVRPEGPSALYRNHWGYFERTNALGAIDHTRFPLLGSFVPGKTHVVVSGPRFPARVHDTNQLSPLPLTDLRVALGIPTASAVSDAALVDLNGDGIDDILQARGGMGPDAMIHDGQIWSRVQLGLQGGSRGFDFEATGTVEFRLSPWNQLWWNTGVVYIGSGGINPPTSAIRLSPSDPLVHGLAVPRGERGVYIGYDPGTGKWQLRVVSTGWQEAIVLIKAASLSNLETVGFKPFVPSHKPAVLLSAGTSFYDASTAAGFSDPSIASNCFSVAVADFDNDTDVDAMMTCSAPLPFRNVPNRLFRNDGSGRFSGVPDAGGVRRPASGVTDGVVTADFDLDGFLDLAVTNGGGIPLPMPNGPSQVFRNASWQAGNRNHWLQVDLRGVRSNRDGIGAQLVLNAGGKTQRRMQRNGVHASGQDFQRVHFGLGSATTVQSLEVIWPNGTRQVEYGLPIDQVVQIVEGQPWWRPFAVNPSAQAFGDVPLSSTRTLEFKLTNRRKTTLPIASVRSVGMQAGQFAVSHLCGTSLVAGGSCVIHVTFRPTTVGYRSAKLMVVAGERSVLLANLGGRGIGP